jgi:uncharacterized protein (TIGR00251 family)
MAGAILKVHVQPGARTSGVVALRDGVLWLRVAAAAQKGQANAALLALLAKLLAVPKDDLTISKGHASRNKAISIQGLSQEGLEQRLRRALSQHPEGR